MGHAHSGNVRSSTALAHGRGRPRHSAHRQRLHAAPSAFGPKTVGSKSAAWYKRRSTIELAALVVLAVLIATGVRAFVFQTYLIPSASMESTLHVGDRVLVDRLSYDFHAVHRGDVIVFKRPATDTTGDTPYLIKRVIGLPGETISADDGYVYIDGRRLIELWLPPNTTTANFAPIHIPNGEYFVMGDNRSDSFDSRGFGPIPKRLIEGRAFVIIWSPSHIGGL